MTRWSPEQKGATRQRILDAAGRLFRQNGYAASGVAEVMHAADLTVGGFYAHFDSKEQLLTEVLGSSSNVLFAGLESLSGQALIRELTRRYLSRQHRDQVAEGCVLPSLAAEAGRQGAAPRAEMQRYLERILELFGGAEHEALAVAALSVGGILLARAVEDRALSDRILKACRRFAEET